MKKIFFLATVLVAATVGIAQFSNEGTNESTVNMNFEKANGFTGFHSQDTTQPPKDSLPPKKDSTSTRF
jgi:hypothetical protein